MAHSSNSLEHLQKHAEIMQSSISGEVHIWTVLANLHLKHQGTLSGTRFDSLEIYKATGNPICILRVYRAFNSPGVRSVRWVLRALQPRSWCNRAFQCWRL